MNSSSLEFFRYCFKWGYSGENINYVDKIIEIVDKFLLNFSGFLKGLIENLILKLKKEEELQNIFFLEFLLKVVITKNELPINFKLL